MAKYQRKPRNKKTTPFERKAVLPIRPGMPEKGGKEECTKIEFTMRATPENWQKMCRLAYDDSGMSFFGKLIYLHLLQDVNQYLEEEIFVTKPRGSHANQQNGDDGKTEKRFMHESRLFVAAAMALTSYWLEKKEEEWPLWFKEMIQTFWTTGSDITDKRNGQLIAVKIVYCWWNNEYTLERRRQGLKMPKNYKIFKKIYVVKESMAYGNIDVMAKHHVEKIIEFKGNEITVQDVINSFP